MSVFGLISINMQCAAQNRNLNFAGFYWNTKYKQGSELKCTSMLRITEARARALQADHDNSQSYNQANQAHVTSITFLWGIPEASSVQSLRVSQQTPRVVSAGWWWNLGEISPTAGVAGVVEEMISYLQNVWAGMKVNWQEFTQDDTEGMICYRQ